MHLLCIGCSATRRVTLCHPTQFQSGSLSVQAADDMRCTFTEARHSHPGASTAARPAVPHQEVPGRAVDQDVEPPEAAHRLADPALAVVGLAHVALCARRAGGPEPELVAWLHLNSTAETLRVCCRSVHTA
jgi:hypothetical protein